MFRIRKRMSGAGLSRRKGERLEQPDPAVPRFVVRQLVMQLRMVHLANDQMRQICSVAWPELKTQYKPFGNIEIQPSFDEVIKLIDISEARGLLSLDEAASLRAGSVRNIDNPIPPLERTSDDALA